jgi:hypothetical protein
MQNGQLRNCTFRPIAMVRVNVEKLSPTSSTRLRAFTSQHDVGVMRTKPTDPTRISCRQSASLSRFGSLPC